MKKITEREVEFARLETQQRRIQEDIESFRGGDRLGREELHERAESSPGRSICRPGR